MADKRTRNTEKTKQHILQAAGELLVIEGFSGFGANALAQKAGVGKPLIYRYFNGPDGVLTALLNKHTSAAREKMNQMPVRIEGLSPEVCRFLYFARIIAFDAVLKAFFRGLLSGDVVGKNAQQLLALCPKTDEYKDNKAATAFLLAGATMIVLMQDINDDFAGAPLKSVKDMAAFETVFVDLARHYFH